MRGAYNKAEYLPKRRLMTQATKEWLLEHTVGETSWLGNMLCVNIPTSRAYSTVLIGIRPDTQCPTKLKCIPFNARFRLWIQPIDATVWWNRSAGVS